MKTYLIRRLFLIVPTLLGISFVTFLVVQLSPGNPMLERIRGTGPGGVSASTIPPEYIAELEKLYGLDKPILVRYGIWLRRFVTFDFGDSYKDQRRVLDKIGETLPVTLQLSFVSIFLVYVISVPLGVFSATHQHTRSDAFITFGLFVLYSLPNFWVAMLLMYFLGGGQHLDLFPVYGMNSQGADEWPWYRWLADRTWHLALPVFCLTYASVAALSRYSRAGMLEEIRKDYVRTARAYGFSEKVVVFKYTLRNSLIPIVTLLGTLLPTLFSGSVIVESIFSVPGMGRLAFEAILSRDYPLIMGILSISALLTLVGLLITDILYAFVDPRIRFE